MCETLLLQWQCAAALEQTNAAAAAAIAAAIATAVVIRVFVKIYARAGKSKIVGSGACDVFAVSEVDISLL